MMNKHPHTKKWPPRLLYGAAFAILLAVEILIALFVRDRFIRPYGGDILVTVLICCFVRIFFPKGIRWLSVWVFLFSALVEIGQYFDFVRLLGLDHIAVIRIALGSTFSWADLLCYAIGCITFWICETGIQKCRGRKNF